MGERRADPAGPSPQLPGRRDAAAGRRRLRPARPPAPPWPGRARPLPAPTRRARPPPAGPGGWGAGRVTSRAAPPTCPSRAGAFPPPRLAVRFCPRPKPAGGPGRPPGSLFSAPLRPVAGVVFGACGPGGRCQVAAIKAKSPRVGGGLRDSGGPIALPPLGGPGPDCAGPSPNAPVAPGPESAGCGGRGPFWRRRCCYRLLGRVGGVGVPVYLRPGVHSRERGFP